MKNSKRELEKLFDILSYRRAYGSYEEEYIIDKYLDVIPKMQEDGFGNRYIVIGKHPTVMFSCHTDTVHHKTGGQKVWVDEHFEQCFSGSGDCLGADDAAGMWLMLQLIQAGKRGLYVFHRAEECGGIGSDYIAESERELLDGIKYCIAFDRRGYEDVITHQASGRCCSDEFASAFAGALGMGFKPSDRGIFTDSANYTHIIPECTNISVGYFDEHTAGEMLDYGFLQKLARKLKSINFESLPVIREAVDPYADWSQRYNSKRRVYPQAQDEYATTVINAGYGIVDDEEDIYATYSDDFPTDDVLEYYETRDMEWQALYDWVRQYPEKTVDMLLDRGYYLEATVENGDSKLKLRAGSHKL
jgi:hypothetical protein